jgi:biopolymer transport protein ExbB
MRKLKSGDVFSAREMSREKDNIVARIVLAGLEKKKDGPVFAKEAMEFCARTEIAALWQNVTYLGDIAAVAPLIGLLGTVIGMIQAFNVIAFQTAVVKPMLLAGGVSKAMVTTAGGLIVAIPALIFYSYFRAMVQRIANSIEGYNTDLIKFVNETSSNK